jgi:putative transposase
MTFGTCPGFDTVIEPMNACRSAGLRRDGMPAGHQLRRGRVSEAGRVYHITTVTRNRVPTFLDLGSGRRVVRSLRAAEEAGAAHTLAFVIMPDHLHWLLELEDGRDLSAVVGRVKASSARMINQSRDRTVPVWQRGFHDHAIRRHEDLRRLARYIIYNPVRAGLVDHPRAYPLWDAVWL